MCGSMLGTELECSAHAGREEKEEVAGQTYELAA